jgi:hypothetical protein
MEGIIFQEPKVGEKIFQRGYSFWENFWELFGSLFMVLIVFPVELYGWWRLLFGVIAFLCFGYDDIRERIIITYFKDHLLFSYFSGLYFPFVEKNVKKVKKVFYDKIEYLVYDSRGVVLIKWESPDSKSTKIKCSTKYSRTYGELIDFINKNKIV